MADDYADEVAPDDIDVQPEDGEAADTRPAAVKLAELLQVPNIAATLEDEELSEIAHKALDGYKLDDNSREDWKKRNEAGMKLATLVTETKDYPFPGASNVKAPLITTAALQFNSMAYPALIKGDRVAKCKVNGHDPQGEKARRAERVSEHASWQMLSEMPEWESDTDRLTLIVAITGVVFRKRYWDPTLARQVSRLVTADRFVYNYRARSIEDCPRVSEELFLYPHEIQERIRDGRFVEFDYGEATPDEDDGPQTDEDGPHKFIEQHRLLDLDGDDYPEPYIVTVHLQTEKVCRIVPNFDMDSVRVTGDGKVAAIRKRDYYVKYVFFESPDGGSYGLGLGSLMGSTVEAVNTTINEMLDAGHLSNLQSGFVSASAGIREKNFRLEKGTFKVINSNMPLNQAIMPMTFPGPSDVLFKLLGLLMEFAKDISSTKDVMTGDTGGKVMQPTTTLALIEQGMKVFSAIFKRLHRALGERAAPARQAQPRLPDGEIYNQFWDDRGTAVRPQGRLQHEDHGHHAGVRSRACRPTCRSWPRRRLPVKSGRASRGSTSRSSTAARSRPRTSRTSTSCSCRRRRLTRTRRRSWRRCSN
jgi:chaperonin GroES